MLNRDEDMQSLASLMSFGKPDIANIEDVDDDDNMQDTDADTTAKINQLASQFGLLTEDLENDEGGKPFDDQVPGMCCTVVIQCFYFSYSTVHLSCLRLITSLNDGYKFLPNGSSVCPLNASKKYQTNPKTFD